MLQKTTTLRHCCLSVVLLAAGDASVNRSKMCSATLSATAIGHNEDKRGPTCGDCECGHLQAILIAVTHHRYDAQAKTSSMKGKSRYTAPIVQVYGRAKKDTMKTMRE